jgi:lactoylglutathione lyase
MEGMKLNHINLTVMDVQKTRRFLEKYLGLQSMEGTKDDDTHVGLLDDDGFVLGLMKGIRALMSIIPLVSILVF